MQGIWKIAVYSPHSLIYAHNRGQPDDNFPHRAKAQQEWLIQK
jgi:hypothetical protein